MRCLRPLFANRGPRAIGGVRRARRASRMARSGSRHSASSAWAIARGSSGGTRTPASPSRSMNRMSPVGVETTGRPAESASLIETGWLSITDAFTNTSASAYRPACSRGRSCRRTDAVARQRAREPPQVPFLAATARNGQRCLRHLRFETRKRFEHTSTRYPGSKFLADRRRGKNGRRSRKPNRDRSTTFGMTRTAYPCRANTVRRVFGRDDDLVGQSQPGMHERPPVREMVVGFPL
jgi:hypothetical protein